jgi:hypothetical protein
MSADSGIAMQPRQATVVATYRYTDEEGTLLYRQERIEPGKDGREKDFRLSRPGDKGGWIYELGDVRRVPYRVRELIRAIANDTTVYIVEGEKCVEALVAHGISATTFVGGSSGWREEYTGWFVDADVVILPDNDDPGRRYAKEIAHDILPLARRVRVIELPGLEKTGDDIVEWLDAGHTVGELVELVDSAAAFQEPEVSKKVGDKWEDPTPLPATRDAAQFCSGVLGPVVAEFTEAVAAETATPVDLAAIAALGSVSTVIAGAVVVEPLSGWREPVNLYLNCLAAPGEGKTPVMAKAVRVLDLIERDRRERLGPEIIEAEARRRVAVDRRKHSEGVAAKAPPGKRNEAEQEALAAARDEASIAVPFVPRLYTRDATPEALTKLLAEQNGRLGFVTDEASEFFQLAERYSATGKGNLGIYVDGFDGKRHVSDRVGREPLVIEHVTLTVCLLGQPIVLEDLGRDRQANGRGLLARFLWSLPGSKVGWRPIHRQSVSEQSLEAWEKLIIDLAGQAEATIEPIVLRLSAEAKHRWDAWREQHEPRLRRELGNLSAIVEWAAKLPGQTLRLAGNLHALRTGGLDGTIDIETMEAALKLAGYFIDHALVVFAKMGADPRLDDASHVLDWLRARRPSEVTTRDVARSKDWDAERARNAFELLADYGWVRREPSGGPGRPSERWATHPDLSCQKLTKPVDERVVSGFGRSEGALRGERLGEDTFEDENLDDWIADQDADDPRLGEAPHDPRSVKCFSSIADDELERLLGAEEPEDGGSDPAGRLSLQHRAVSLLVPAFPDVTGVR